MADLILPAGPPGAGKTTIAPWEASATHHNEACTGAGSAACGQYARGGFAAMVEGMVLPR